MTKKEIFQKIADETGHSTKHIYAVFAKKRNNTEIEKLLKEYKISYQKRKFAYGDLKEVAEQTDYNYQQIWRINTKQVENYKIEKKLNEAEERNKQANKERKIKISLLKNFKFAYGTLSKIGREYGKTSAEMWEIKKGLVVADEILERIYEEYIKQIPDKLQNFVYEETRGRKS